LLFFTLEDGSGITWKVFYSVEGDIAPSMGCRVRVGAIDGHLKVAFGRVLKRRGGLALGRGNGGHECKRTKRNAG
jgi:hypothetical protein